MNYLKSIVLALIVFTLAGSVNSCEDNARNRKSGAIVLNSIYNITNSISGFHFESESFRPFPSSAEPLPDIIVDKFTRVNGDILPGFSSPENDHGFALVSSSGSLAESKSFFESYREFDLSLDLGPSTDTVKKYQVWILRTRDDVYVKLNVTDVRLQNNASGDYLEVSLDYQYQDDGTTLFPK